MVATYPRQRNPSVAAEPLRQPSPYGSEIPLWQQYPMRQRYPPLAATYPYSSNLPQAQEAEETVVQAAAEMRAMAGTRCDAAELNVGMEGMGDGTEGRGGGWEE